MQQAMKFYYRNYKGVCGYRTVLDPKFWFGSTEFHKEPQWLIRAYDIDKDAIRDFAVNDIIEFIREV